MVVQEAVISGMTLIRKQHLSMRNHANGGCLRDVASELL